MRKLFYFFAILLLSAPATAQTKTFFTPALERSEPLILYTNFPEPVTQYTTIIFHLPEQSYVKLCVYDVFCRRAAILANEEMGAGNHTVRFYVNNIPDGLYCYYLTTSAGTTYKIMHVEKAATPAVSG